MIKEIKTSGNFFKDVSRVINYAVNHRKKTGKLNHFFAWISKHMRRE